MKIVFMGTPDFAVATLNTLLQSRHEVAAVFTRADTPKNRGMKMLPPPVKIRALEAGIPVFQPASLKTQQCVDILRELSPDVIVVAAYGRILPPGILELPKYGCINVHASLLPAYRGASPIATAIARGETQTGVTIMQMNEGLDTGDMLLKVPVEIGEDESFGVLQERLAQIGAQALLETLDALEGEGLLPQKQDDSAASYAPLIKNQDALVGFNAHCDAVSCTIRAYDPVPGAFGFLGEEKIKLYGAQPVPQDGQTGAVGSILDVGKKGMLVQCAQGCVRIAQVQGAGGKKMAADAFFRGHGALLKQKFQ